MSHFKTDVARNVDEFMAALAAVAPPAGLGAYSFIKPGGTHGFVQFIILSDHEVSMHRLWTLEPGGGNGSHMLEAICDLADRFGVAIRIQPLPFGRKPFPLVREQLIEWYRRHGFEGNRRKMIRQPRSLTADGADGAADGLQVGLGDGVGVVSTSR
jgi:hypothetical protein